MLPVTYRLVTVLLPTLARMTLASIGAPELLLVLVLVLLLFGSTQLPRLGRSLGQAKNELKKAAAKDPAEPNGEPPAS